MDSPESIGSKKPEKSQYNATTPLPGNTGKVNNLNVRPGIMPKVSTEALKNHNFTYKDVENKAAGTADQNGRMKTVFYQAPKVVDTIKKH